jgi:Reverse transcriptase (RNA-dependent DNA polymerase)
MLCVPKKNGTLCTVFDLREQNENIVKDVTPFTDQDIIRHDIARAAYRTKLDMSEAYEQICVDPAHVSKTAFTTILGTFRSQVMQMGDCNAPSRFQRLMTAIFCDCIGRFVHVYMDNIFIFSCSIEEHEKHLGIVFDRLRKNHLFLSKKKVDLYSERMECLGHIIDDRGIHADADKMQRVREWRTPRTYNDVQRFLGIVQYLAHYMPDVSA